MAHWLSPFRKESLPMATSLQGEVNRLFDSFFDDFGTLAPSNGYAPAIDLEETADAFLVSMEIPGVDPKNVEITAVGSELTIKGEAKGEDHQKDKTWHRRERRFGTFVRTIALPTQVDTEKIQATYRNGLLELTLPKRAEARPRAIKVQIGS
jgi:HSP20 family protein